MSERVAFRVTLIESDSWSGQSSWTEDYATLEEAQARVTSVNEENVSPIAPSYYVKAKKKIEAVSLLILPSGCPDSVRCTDRFELCPPACHQPSLPSVGEDHG